jgi:thiol:disulfide interchange protein DsbA
MIKIAGANFTGEVLGMHIMKKLGWVFALIVVAVAPSMADEYVENSHYEMVTPAQPTSVADKIEVVELFWYGCPHCYQFEPSLQKWLKSKPANVAFVRVPGIFRPEWSVLARAYYTAEALGVLDKVHDSIFGAVHELKRPLQSEDQLAAFFAEQGVKEEDFRKTFRSFAVETKVRRAQELSQRYGAKGVPTMIVNGKYRVSAGLSGVQTHANTIKVVDALIKREASGKK